MEREETHGVKMERNRGGNRTFPVPGGGGGGSGAAVAPPQGYELSGKIMLCSVVVLFASVLLVLFLHLYLRWRILRRSSSFLRRRAPRLVFSGEGDAAAAAPRGLDPAVLGSLPVIVFSHGGGGGDEEEGAVAECAVCLSEFAEGEKVRTLPRCGHRFHIQCIDMWFLSHSTCPLCRSAVERPPPPPLIAAAADECVNPSSSSEPGMGELRIEVGRGSEEDLVLALGLGFGEKSPGSRMVLLRRLLSRDLRIYRGAEEADHERGEEAPPPPPLPGVAAV
uniref:RING-type E3 ubiquitin transferase n=1 Tax=Ananas comosus var. bracteatus TaxID=296719 RepID=A0A6V7PCA9_ANACO|nr:unnamed protein product [Ananas comosus var. bracteatus]